MLSRNLVACSSCVNLELHHDHASSCTTDICLGTAGEALAVATISRSFSQDRCLPLLTMTLNAQLTATPCTACICRLTLGSCLNCLWTCHTLKQSIMCGSVSTHLHQQHRAMAQSWVCLHDSSDGYAQCEYHRGKQYIVAWFGLMAKPCHGGQQQPVPSGMLHTH